LRRLRIVNASARYRELSRHKTQTRKHPRGSRREFAACGATPMVIAWELCVVIIGFFEFALSNNIEGDVPYPQSHLTEDSEG